DVEQCAIGDCYFPGAMASLASTPAGRRAIADAITDNRDGTYTVSFYVPPQKGSGGVSSRRVSFRVTAEVPMNDGKPRYGHGGESGALWFPLMEKAWALYKGGGSYGGAVSGYPSDV